jgi:hypothetical protein
LLSTRATGRVEPTTGPEDSRVVTKDTLTHTNIASQNHTHSFRHNFSLAGHHTHDRHNGTSNKHTLAAHHARDSPNNTTGTLATGTLAGNTARNSHSCASPTTTIKNTLAGNKARDSNNTFADNHARESPACDANISAVSTGQA